MTLDEALGILNTRLKQPALQTLSHGPAPGTRRGPQPFASDARLSENFFAALRQYGFSGRSERRAARNHAAARRASGRCESASRSRAAGTGLSRGAGRRRHRL